MVQNEKRGNPLFFFFFFPLRGQTSADVLTWVCGLWPACVGFREKTGATEPGPQDGCTWRPRRRRAKPNTHTVPSLRNRLRLENCFHASDYFGPLNTIGPTIFYLMQMENRRFPALTSKGCQSLHFQ